jgi:hypothetical protein
VSFGVYSNDITSVANEIFLFEAYSHYVIHAGLELWAPVVLLPPSPE